MVFTEKCKSCTLREVNNDYDQRVWTLQGIRHPTDIEQKNKGVILLPRALATRYGRLQQSLKMYRRVP